MFQEKIKILILHIGDSVSVNGTVIETFDLYFNLLEHGYSPKLVITLPDTYLPRVQLRIRKSFNDKFYAFYKTIAHSHQVLSDVIEQFNDYDFIFLTGTTYLRLNSSNLKAKIITYISTISYFHLTNYVNLSKLYCSKDFKERLITLNSLHPLFYSKNFYFLKTPFADKLLAKHEDISCNCLTYYVPFNKYRLESMLVSNKKDCYNNSKYEDDVIKNLGFNAHDYSSIKWSRRDYYHRGLYLEIKGKIPFEFNYFQKPVYYDASTKQFDDGFTDYLRLFGIDDNKSQEISILRNELINKLVGYRKNDLILEILNT